MKVNLSGKAILVTGASRGIGAALAAGLAGAGARVAVHYHRSRDAAERLAETLGQGARAFHADLADPAHCERLFEEVVDAFDGIDVLINNAAISPATSQDMPVPAWLETWATTMAVNVRAVELLSRLAVQHLTERGGGRIINIASRAAFRGDTADYMTYAASKAGVVALTRSIARAFGKRNIAAFVVAPGFVRTDMAQDFIDAYGEDYVVGDLALNRLTTPADLAPLVVLLASGLADHATGGTFDVNAGSYVH